ncbi:MAG: glycoside hydrolase family 3 protein [Actinobacteria bacterium]|nr:glycoside hydrolase family 3 protein [Actinomycetota bacterium]
MKGARSVHRGATAVVVLMLGVVVCGCGDGGSVGEAASSSTATTDQTSGTTAGSTDGGTTPGTATTTTAPCTQAARVSAMPIGARAAQLVVIPSLDFNIDQLRSVVASGVGGVLFLGRATAPTDLAVRIAAARDAAAIPPSFMADQEGGGVQRMKGVVDPIPWPRTMGQNLDPAGIEALAERTGTQLRATGIDVDLAPVLDVDDRPGPSSENPAGKRSFGATAAEVTTSGTAFMRGLVDAGVMPVIKHFPGLGHSTMNTDVGPASTRSIADLRQVDLLPFAAAIDAGAPAVMVANASVPGLTSQPAVIAPEVVHDLLREELGFDGLVLTDSLSAGAIADAGLTLPEAAVASVAAGADQVLFGSTLDTHELALLEPANVAATSGRITAALVDAVAAGKLPEARLDEAVDHVLRGKGIDLCRG